MGWFNRDERAAAMGIKQTGVQAGGVFAAAKKGPCCRQDKAWFILVALKYYFNFFEMASTEID
jgi:hypothetical protein